MQSVVGPVIGQNVLTCRLVTTPAPSASYQAKRTRRRGNKPFARQAAKADNKKRASYSSLLRNQRTLKQLFVSSMPMKIKDIIQGLGDVKLADFDPFHKDSKAKSNDGKGGGDDEHDVFNDDKESRTLDAEFKARLEKAKQGAHRLKDVFAAPIQMVADFIPPVYPKSNDEKNFINKALGDSFVFSHLGARERNTLIDAFEPVEMSEGEIIIKQGDIGDYFYVLQKGKVQYVVDGQAVGDASAGDTFGEIALLHDCPRAATCLALSSCRLFRVGQKTFRRILMSYAMKNDDETKKLLTKVEFFKDLDDRALAKVASALSVVSYKKGDVIARKGDEGKTFYIIQKGKIGASDILLGGTKYDDLVLGPGEHFGEGAIVNNTPVLANITALENSTALVMSKENFQQTIGDFKALFQIGWDRKKLQAIPLASGQKLSSQETDMLASLVVNETYPKGHVFYQEGTPADPYLFLVRSGKVDITTSFMGIEFLTGIKAHKGETKSIGSDGFFGEDMLNPDKKDAGAKAHPRYTAVAAEECVVGVLSLKTIVSVIASAAGSGLALSDLEKHKLLGAGTFGKVFLVTKKGTKDAYALKIQYKKQLIEYGQAAGVIRERDVMAKLDHPFIIKLVTSYQDEKHVYMLMKLYLGGELRSVMQNRRRNFLPEWAARFYAAGVLEGLGYMHRRHIIYRDLKPENVLLDSDGYTVIVDLGFAKYVPTKTYTFCGTPLYLAPEIILQRGHDKSADLWSWGVMLYEMIVGFTPFWNDDMDQHALMKAIVKGEFDFPTGNFMSENSKSLIRAMLTVNVKHRLGCFAAGDLDIRNHPFFKEIDWTLLAKKQAKAPMVPKIKDPLDANNFRNWKDEAVEDDGKPLTEKQQKLFKDF